VFKNVGLFNVAWIDFENNAQRLPKYICVGVWERALEIFWQKSARIYDERVQELTCDMRYAICEALGIPANERGVNRSRRQKISAREQIDRFIFNACI